MNKRNEVKGREELSKQNTKQERMSFTASAARLYGTSAAAAVPPRGERAERRAGGRCRYAAAARCARGCETRTVICAPAPPRLAARTPLVLHSTTQCNICQRTAALCAAACGGTPGVRQVNAGHGHALRARGGVRAQRRSANIDSRWHLRRSDQPDCRSTLINLTVRGRGTNTSRKQRWRVQACRSHVQTHHAGHAATHTSEARAELTRRLLGRGAGSKQKQGLDTRSPSKESCANGLFELSKIETK